MLQGTSPVILVVDDEPLVLSSVCNVLRFAGFVVLQADGPEEALRTATERRDAIHLLLSDVIMPGLTGPRLADQVRALHPETLFLFMAGLPDHPDVVQGVLPRGHAFLQKPFLPKALVEKVRLVLASGQSS